MSSMLVLASAFLLSSCLLLGKYCVEKTFETHFQENFELSAAFVDLATYGEEDKYLYG